jgi:hypothetical protein
MIGRGLLVDFSEKIRYQIAGVNINDDKLFPPSSLKPLAEAIPGAQVFLYDSILGPLGCALDLQKANEKICNSDIES